MAIVFDCPFCGVNYRLKDEVGGKTATCKNPNCRKVIPIPMANGPVRPTKHTPADLDALAAAAFADEPAQKTAEATIEVTCARCDHRWMVEASREGKNVLCPECRNPNRVPTRKKDEKADWRTGGGPSMAKRETGMDREGAFGTAHMGGISDDTARKIVSERVEEEEPEERRKKLIKRGIITFVVLGGVGAGGYFAFKTRKEMKADASMVDAVKEVEDNASNDAKAMAVIHRASGEHHARTAENDKDATAALNDLKLARNTIAAKPPDTAIDRNA